MLTDVQREDEGAYMCQVFELFHLIRDPALIRTVRLCRSTRTP